MTRLALMLALLALGCAGMRAGAFAGYMDETGTIAGTPQGGPIDYEGGGPFGGVFLSGELTAPSPPREAPILRALAERQEEREKPAEHGGFDFNSPLAYGLYSMVAIVGFIAKAIFGAAGPTTPTQ